MFWVPWGRRPLLDEQTTQWLFDIYAWALRNFGSDVFHEQTRLVLPTDEDFPGRDSTVHGMARLIFERVQAHAGLAHWPCRLVEPAAFEQQAAPSRLTLRGAIRGSKGIAPEQTEDAQRLTFTYDPALVRNPEALIAGFAHSFAHFMGTMGAQRPPTGEENWPHLTEVLAVFMGFGIMMANSTFNVAVSACGACRGPAPGRVSFLSQYDIVYALAIFCVLKDIPARIALRHLKSPLHGFFKGALREVRGRKDDLASLRGIVRPLSTLG